MPVPMLGGLVCHSGFYPCKEKGQMNGNHGEFSEYIGVFPRYFLPTPPGLEGHIC